MSRRTKGHYPFSLKFNRGESFHNPPAHVQSLSRSVQFFFRSRQKFLCRFGKIQSYSTVSVVSDVNITEFFRHWVPSLSWCRNILVCTMAPSGRRQTSRTIPLHTISLPRPNHTILSCSLLIRNRCTFEHLIRSEDAAGIRSARLLASDDRDAAATPRGSLPLHTTTHLSAIAIARMRLHASEVSPHTRGRRSIQTRHRSRRRHRKG